MAASWFAGPNGAPFFPRGQEPSWFAGPTGSQFFPHGPTISAYDDMVEELLQASVKMGIFQIYMTYYTYIV